MPNIDTMSDEQITKHLLEREEQRRQEEISEQDTIFTEARRLARNRVFRLRNQYDVTIGDNEDWLGIKTATGGARFATYHLEEETDSLSFVSNKNLRVLRSYLNRLDLD